MKRLLVAVLLVWPLALLALYLAALAIGGAITRALGPTVPRARIHHQPAPTEAQRNARLLLNTVTKHDRR